MENSSNNEYEKIIKDFDGLPFHLKLYFDDQDIINSVNEANPLIDSVISLNIYLAIRQYKDDIKSLSMIEDKFRDLVDKWIKENSDSRNIQELRWEWRSFLIVAGTYVRYDVLFQDHYLKENEEKIKELKLYSRIQRDVKKIVKIGEEYVNVEQKEEGMEQIKKISNEMKMYDLILNKHGHSILYYYLVEDLVDQLYERLKINKTETCDFIGEVFLLFRLIGKGNERINFGGNLYRQINRIKKEKITELKHVCENLI